MNDLSISSALPDALGLQSGQYWGELRIFAEVARARSFNRAAERLGISQPTIARKVRRLQDSIGAQLFVATKNGVRLTERGDELVAALLAFDQSLFSITRDLKARDRDIEGVVRVSISDGMAAFFAAPAVPDFAARHPRVQIHLRTLTAFNELRENQTDMMLTMASSDRGDITSRRLGTLHFVPVATHAYVGSRGMPTRDNLEEHLFLQSHLYQAPLPLWRGWQEACGRGRIAHFCDNPFAYGMMVKQGMGIGLLGTYTSRLPTAVVPDLGIHVPVPLYAVALTERLAAKPVRLVYEWLCDTFGAANPWFAPTLDMSSLPASLPSMALMFDG